MARSRLDLMLDTLEIVGTLDAWDDIPVTEHLSADPYFAVTL